MHPGYIALVVVGMIVDRGLWPPKPTIAPTSNPHYQEPAKSVGRENRGPTTLMPQEPEWEWVTELVRPGYWKVRIIPAQYAEVRERLKVREAQSYWVREVDKLTGCYRDRLVHRRAVYQTISRVKQIAPAREVREYVPKETRTHRKLKRGSPELTT